MFKYYAEQRHDSLFVLKTINNSNFMDIYRDNVFLHLLS